MLKANKYESYLNRWIDHCILKPVDSISLAYFRIMFGLIMLFSQARFVLKGWVYKLYIEPRFFFKYYGFEWVKTLPGNWMYLPWIAMIIALVFVIIGKYYKISIISFFLLFSYTELLDVTNYLNHYILVTYLIFLMIFLPMDCTYSYKNPHRNIKMEVPAWMVNLLKFQVGIVYFLAGVSKIKFDWLIHAQPLQIWLSSCKTIPIVGTILSMKLVAYLFSWIGMFFDLSAPFLLINHRTRRWEYFIIVVFHVITMLLFYIGIFPLLMIFVATIFFSSNTQKSILDMLLFWRKKHNDSLICIHFYSCKLNVWTSSGLIFYCFFQVLFPFRYILYPGYSLWTEQGFRYSWNVMLIEKTGFVEFNVHDKFNKKSYIEIPRKYLTPLQEKMMSTQPDLILQYAHFLANMYQHRTLHSICVTVDSYVSLNGQGGQMYIDPSIDLSLINDSFKNKYWITSFHYKN